MQFAGSGINISSFSSPLLRGGVATVATWVYGPAGLDAFCTLVVDAGAAFEPLFLTVALIMRVGPVNGAEWIFSTTKSAQEHKKNIIKRQSATNPLERQEFLVFRISDSPLLIVIAGQNEGY
jgi:hypothetical protein